MLANQPTDPDTLTANVELAGPNWRLRAALTVPTRPTRVRELLPMVQSLTDAVVGAAIRHVEEQGKAISCQQGCGACCRQLVPVSESEARNIADCVGQMPEPARTEVRDRFAKAQRRLAEVRLLEPLMAQREWTYATTWQLGLDYFSHGIACPFLHDESCSIYHDRPTACREYLVTSPAEHCSDPTPETVRCVRLPLKVSTALARCDTPTGEPPLRWVPLILAPQWAAANTAEPSPRPGPKIVEALINQLTGKAVPGDSTWSPGSNLVEG